MFSACACTWTPGRWEVKRLFFLSVNSTWRPGPWRASPGWLWRGELELVGSDPSWYVIVAMGIVLTNVAVAQQWNLSSFPLGKDPPGAHVRGATIRHHCCWAEQRHCPRKIPSEIYPVSISPPAGQCHPRVLILIRCLKPSSLSCCWKPELGPL